MSPESRVADPPPVAELFRASPQQTRWRRLRARARGWCPGPQLLCKVTANIDPRQVQRAISRAVADCEILRTELVGSLDGGPAQRIRATAGWLWHEIDLSRLGSAEQIVRIEDLFASWLHRDPPPWPLTATWIRLDGPSAALLLAASGANADARSLELLMTRLLEGDLTTDEVQYADVTEVFHDLLTDESTRSGRAFWQDRLKDGMASSPSLPGVKPPGDGTWRPPAFHTWTHSAALVTGIERRALDLDVTPADLLAAGWAILLHRLSDTPSLEILTAAEGRTFDELAPAIGCFARRLPLRLDLAGNDRLVDVVGRMAAERLAIAAHQDYFEPSGDEGHSGEGLTVAFECRTTHPEHPVAEPVLAYSGLGPAALELRCQLGSGCSTLFYDPALWNRPVARRLLDRFRTLIEEILADASTELAIGDLDILAASEKAQLAAINDNEEPLPSIVGFHQLLEEQADRHPDLTAVQCSRGSFTFATLDQRANQLAHLLRQRGVGTETRVALAMGRTSSTVMALYAVLKAGGAYLILDSALPANRRRFLAEDAKVALVIAERAADLTLGDLPILGLEEACEAINAQPIERPTPLSTPDTLAYVLYTSGSTGLPKGVMVTHGGLVDHVVWGRREFDLGPDQRVPVHTPFAFDLTVTALLIPLAAGTTTVLLDEAPGVESLAKALLEGGSWHLLKMTPSHLEALRYHLTDSTTPLEVGVVVTGGESLRGENLDWWFERAPGCRMVNEYGPTEAVVGCATYAIPRGQRLRGIVTIGEPTANTRIHLLDRRGRPVPIGVPGELCVAGIGLARGYLERPALTASRFLPDPAATKPGARIYATGDLAFWRDDGRLMYISRIDRQLKIRGHRVEPGEIEAVLRRHPAVRETAISSRRVASGLQLVAYVVADQPTEPPATADLQDFLAEKLPPYMVPGVFAFPTAMPLNATGKVDYKKLPPPESISGPSLQTAPRSQQERILEALWREVLQVQAVGDEDRFFHLGGDSILAIQLAAKARAAGLELSPRQVFEHPTLADQAAAARPLDHSVEGPPLVEAEASVTSDHKAEATKGKTTTDTTPPETGTPATDTSEPGYLVEPALRARLLADPEIEDVYPLTPAQQGMVLFQLYNQQTAAYMVQSGFLIDGPVDVGALRDSWAWAIARHPILRTSFLWQGLAEPLQRVHRHVEVPWHFEDWRGQATETQRAQLRAAQAAEIERGFDIEAPGLLRLRLIRLDDTRYHFSWLRHHALLDGWSVSLLTREISELYAAGARTDSEMREATPAPPPFGDYLGWLARQDRSEIERFWRRTFRDFDGPARLAIDRAPGRLAAAGLAGGIRGSLPPAESARVQDAARKCGVTLNTVIQAALAVLLGRYSGSRDVLYGATVSGRPAELPGVDRMMGLFINTLAMRVRIDDQRSLGEWLLHLQDRQLELQGFAHTALSDVRGWSGVSGEQSLFDCLLIFQGRLPSSQAGSRGEDGGLTARPSGAFSRVGEPLTVMVGAGDSIHLAVSYERARFDTSTAQRLHRALCTLVATLLDDADKGVDDLPILSDAERRQVLQEGVGNGPHTPPADDVLAGILAQAALRPESVAIVDDGTEVLYAELANRVEEIARGLTGRMIGPEDLVALYLERSADRVTAMLGVLQSGAAFLPLDASQPPNHTATLIRRAGACLVLGDQASPSIADVCVVPLLTLVQLTDEPADSVGIPDRDAAASAAVEPATKQRLAYTLFTSGSTGMPKGVMVSRSALDGFVSAATKLYGISYQDRVLQLASIAFDTSIEEIFPCLVRGGTLVLRPPEMFGDMADFLDACRRKRLTVLDLPTAFWHDLVSALEADPELRLPEGVRLVILGGERASGAKLRSWFKVVDTSVRLVNSYGPTEATVVATAAALGTGLTEPEQTADDSDPPIGQPIEGARAYVLDQGLRLLGPGMPGQLHLGGAMLARGYLGAAAATAECFIPDPFAENPGARLYRTGDRALLLEGGDLQFLGRGDRQLKIRGFRVEPAEIEVALLANPIVRHAAVIPVVDKRRDKTLVAWLEADVQNEDGAKQDGAKQDEPSTPTVEAIRHWLRGRLPSHLIPGSIRLRSSLPRTTSGKIDRRALAASTAAESPEIGSGSAAAIRQPRNRVECILAQLWERLFDVAPLGLEADFFALGGHSLLAMRLMNEVRATLGRSLPIAVLFEAPTLADFALRVSEAIEPGDHTPMVKLRRSGSRSPLFLVHPVGGTVLSYRTLAASLETDHPIVGIQADAEEAAENRPRTLEAQAARYVEWIRESQSNGPYWLGGWSLGGVIALEMACLLEEAGEPVELVALIDSRIPNPGAAPPVDDLRLLPQFAHDLGLGQTTLSFSREELRSVPPEQRLELILDKAASAGILPPGFEPVQIRRLFEMFTWHYRIANRFRPRPYQGRVALLRRAEVTAQVGQEVSLGWNELLPNLEVHTLQGDHYSLLREPNVQTVCRVLETCLK